ncbi:hypothetical protein PILCRDRAFT_9627 [Piloderma croceum F 1598]|uniref:Uncharacterized protein n=1 Tax=Piloderma croceum (strain F 1598) TaxID=765440 RepID=A0A0C3F6Y5_PILCF|nr:hypothetical protein PILCRDRAFT_9627 [Piloderma croceum F 1598]
MPAALQRLATSPAASVGDTAIELTENVPLMLPSSLSEDERATGCTPQLVTIEQQLREAQCQSSLERLRMQLHIKSQLRIYKEHNIHHQGPNTRTHGLLDRNNVKIRLQRDKYRAARQALIHLPGGTEAVKRWHKLKDCDLRCMEEKDTTSQEREKERRRVEKEKKTKKNQRQGGNTIAPGEGRREISWLWMGTATGDETDEMGMHDAIQVEWAKAWACTRRWNEEVQLLNEEMRRVLKFHKYKAQWWEDRQSRSGDLFISAGLGDGIRAYAECQAQLHRDLAIQFRGMWADFQGGGAIPAPTEDQADKIQQSEMEADGDEEVSDEEEEEEGVAVEPDWEFIAEDSVE